jgi:hypothetical protein
LISGAVAAAIYIVIALATGTIASAAIIGGLIVGLVTFVIAFIIGRVIASRRS